ncbi:MAG: hypothetical protein ACI9YB_003465, partial [Halioglobus sp.]
MRVNFTNIFKASFISPYSAAASLLKNSFTSRVDDIGRTSLFYGKPIASFAEENRKVNFFTGMILLLPIVNIVIYQAICHFSKKEKPLQNEGPLRPKLPDHPVVSASLNSPIQKPLHTPRKRSTPKPELSIHPAIPPLQNLSNQTLLATQLREAISSHNLAEVNRIIVQKKFDVSLDSSFFSLACKMCRSDPSENRRKILSLLISKGVPIENKEDKENAILWGGWPTYQALEERDMGICDQEDEKRQIEALAHRFAVKDLEVTVNNEKHEIRGRTIWESLFDITQSIRKNLSKELCPQLQGTVFKRINESFENAAHHVDQVYSFLRKMEINEEIVANHQKGDTLILPFHWAGHCTTIVIKGDKLIKCNRGLGSDQAGMEVYHMENPNIFTPELLDTIFAGICDKNPEKAEKFWSETINQRLSLRKEKTIETSDQHGPRCTWTSQSLSLKAACYLELLAKNIPERKAEAISHSVYKIWKEKDR